ncbi:MAG: hypothetical protein U0470_06895 [Anaerolineae bacterium]
MRNPALPPLDDLLAQGRVTLLLDALNEMPAAGKDLRARLQLWKIWLQELVAAHPGNRIVFSCRSLDYSQPLSTPDLRVPQVRVEPLSDDQVQDFLALYGRAAGAEIWAALDGTRRSRCCARRTSWRCSSSRSRPWARCPPGAPRCSRGSCGRRCGGKWSAATPCSNRAIC